MSPPFRPSPRCWPILNRWCGVIQPGRWGRLGGDEARQVLGRAMWQEEDEQVRGEIAAAAQNQRL